MTIIQAPALYNFAGNIPDLIVDTTEQMPFTLLRGGMQIVAETYTPTPNDRIVINLRNLLELLIEVPGYEETATPIPQYTYTLGSTTGTFYCLPGGHGAAVSTESFLRENFLTWQPQTRITLYHTPHRLRYAALIACVCKVKAYFADGTSAGISLLTMTAGNIYTMDVSFGTIRGKFDSQPTYYDVWIEDNAGKAMTWVQRYMLTDFQSGTNDFFVFANSLGGFDTIRFSGDRNEINKLESVNAVFDDQTLEYDIDRTRSWKKFTGYIADEQLRIWVLDFFNSPYRFHQTESGTLQRIYVSDPKLENTSGQAAGYEFTYIYSKQSRYINIERAEIPPLLEITDPASEVFFLAPRLNQFESADPASSADYMIPIQAANLGKWLALSLASLKDHIKPTGLDVDALRDYLTDHRYTTQEWVAQQNFLTEAVMDSYLPKSIWNDAFEIVTVDGVKVISAKLDFLGQKGITAYADVTLSGGSASGALVDLVDVAVPSLAAGDILKYNGTHFVNIPLSSVAGSSSWNQITGKPDAFKPSAHVHPWSEITGAPTQWAWGAISGKPSVYPTDWASVAGRPASLPASDVYAWAKAITKPGYTYSEIGGRPTKLSDLTDDLSVWKASNFAPSSKLDQSVWNEAFEVTTINGVRVISAKLDVLGLKGMTSYSDGFTPGGAGGGLDYQLLKQALSGAVTPDGYPFPISTTFLGAIDKNYLTGKLSGTYADKVHTHLWANITDRPTALPASDVYPWAKAAAKPGYSWSEIAGKPTTFTPEMHTHTYLWYTDTRGIELAPYDSSISKGLTTVHLKNNGVGGLTDGGGFYRSIYLHGWDDNSGGAAHNLAFTDNGNMWLRTGSTSWGNWMKFWHAGNSNLPTVDWSARSITAAGTVTAPTFSGALSGTATRANGLLYNNDAGGSYFLQAMQLSAQNTAGDLPVSNGWYHILKFNHGNGDTYYNRTLALPFSSNEVYTRRRENGTASTWSRLWGEHNANRSDADWSARNIAIAGTISANDWFRSYGSTGWYSASYGGGIFMQDQTWVRVYNGKSFLVPGNSRTEGSGYFGGPVQIESSAVGNFNEGLRIAKAANNWAGIVLGCNRGTTEGVDGGWFIGRTPDNTLIITYNISSVSIGGGIELLPDKTVKIYENLLVSGSVTAPSFVGNLSGTASTSNSLTYGGAIAAIGGTTTIASGLSLYGVYNNGYPCTYGNLLRFGGLGSGEMLFGWTGDTSVGDLYYRSKRDTASTPWSGWVKVWDSANSNLSTVDWAAKNINAAGSITATKIVIDGITIDVFNGALRVNGNVLATGGITAQN